MIRDGHVEKYTARLVALGYTRVEGNDSKETFCPVIKSIRTLLAFTDEKDRHVHQLNTTQQPEWKIKQDGFYGNSSHKSKSEAK